MGNRKETKEKNNTLKINGAVSIYEVADIHRKFLHSFAENSTINIDLGDVESCDVAGLQIILSAIKTGEKNGKQITISKVSEAFREIARLVGIQQEIINDNGGQKCQKQS